MFHIHIQPFTLDDFFVITLVDEKICQSHYVNFFEMRFTGFTEMIAASEPTYFVLMMILNCYLELNIL